MNASREARDQMIDQDQAATPPSIRAAGPDDAEVIARSRHEPELFALLFRRHAPRIQRYIARRIGPDAAEDVLAETFLTAFDQRHRYDPERPDARPWLYGIATNLVGRHRRAEVRQLTAFGRTGVDPVVAAFTEAADARVSAGAVRQRLAAELARLRPAYRDALLLVVWGELSYEEAAGALGVPVGTVRSRISRARKALRTALGGVDPTSIQEDFA
jgi:RNA polymerase sigma-70 factor (ECF subfamily)